MRASNSTNGFIIWDRILLPRLNMRKDKNGTILTDREQVLGRWVKHFKLFLEGENLEETQTEKPNREAVQPTEENIENCTTPTRKEMIASIYKLHNNKSPSRDGIPAEVVKNAGDNLINHLHKLMVYVWNTEIMPQDWNTGHICPIYKKGDRLNCRNHRGITLLNVSYKIFTNILYGRIQPYTEKVLQSYQCDFQPGKSIVNQIYTI
jgi:hypothetical protein